MLLDTSLLTVAAGKFVSVVSLVLFPGDIVMFSGSGSG